MVKEHNVVMLPTEKASDLCLLDNDLYYLDGDEGTNYQHLYITSDEDGKKGDYVLDLGLNKVIHLHSKEFADAFKTDRTIPGIINSCPKIIATTDESLTIKKSATGVTDGGRKRTFYSNESLPQPSPDFIKLFVEEYNKGRQIKTVLVEHQLFVSHKDKNCFIPCEDGEELIYSKSEWHDYKWELKLADNNTINISQAEKEFIVNWKSKPIGKEGLNHPTQKVEVIKNEERMYSREEVIAFAKKTLLNSDDFLGRHETIMIGNGLYVHEIGFNEWIKNNLNKEI